MATASDSVDTAKRAVASTAKTTAKAVSRIALGAFLLGYLTLWGGLAARHYAMGDVDDAVLTVTVFVLPLVGLVLYRAGRAYGTPDVDVEGTPSLS
jgi:hypothetical protein